MIFNAYSINGTIVCVKSFSISLIFTQLFELNIFELNKTLISPINTVKLNQTAARPLKGGLKTGKIEKEFDIKCVELKYSLNMIKSRLKE